MRAKRRMGPENAATRTVLMDATELVMQEQGYAAVSARTVAARAGLKYQIVFYYFETMDDLLLATYRRNMQKMWVQLETVMKAEQPLHALWELWSHPFDGAISLEFMAAANHNAVIRAEKIAFGKRMQKLLKETFSARRFEHAPDAKVITPLAITTVLACIGGIMAFEGALGMEDVHVETRALVDWGLDRLEPSANKKKPKTKTIEPQRKRAQAPATPAPKKRDKRSPKARA